MRYDSAPKSRTRSRLQYRLLQLFERFGEFWLGGRDGIRNWLLTAA